MIKRLALVHVALFVAWPAAAQIATVPVGSLTQILTKDTTLALAVSLYGYTAKSPTPRLLANQTLKLAPVSLLQPEVRAEFPGYQDAALTVMQLVVKSTIETPTFQTTTETVAPKQPLSINVPAGQRLWVVYSAPAGQQGQLRFYVGTPPPGSTSTSPSTGSAAPSGTRVNQVGQSFIDSEGNKWSLGPPDPARGAAPVILRNGVVFGVAFELVWQNGLVNARNAGGWWSIGPSEASTSAWQHLSSGPSTPPASSPTVPTTPSAAPSGTRISQVGQSFTDSAGNKWSLGPPDPARGAAPVILRNGVVFGVAFELVWQNGLVHARNTGGWWSIGPREANTSAWQHLTSGPSAPTAPSPTAPTAPSPTAPTNTSTSGALTPWGKAATVKAMTAPIVYVKNFGAKGDGVSDDTAAINRAITSMATGGTLVFEPGKTYLTRKNVVVSKPSVKLWGYGAKLYAVTTDAEIAAVAVQQGVRLDAPGTEILGFDIISNLKRRLSGANGGPNKALVLVSNSNTKVIDNRLTDGHGIFVWREPVTSARAGLPDHPQLRVPGLGGRHPRHRAGHAQWPDLAKHRPRERRRHDRRRELPERRADDLQYRGLGQRHCRQLLGPRDHGDRREGCQGPPQQDRSRLHGRGNPTVR